MASVQTTGAKAEAEQPQELVELKPEASTKRPGKGSVFCLSLIAILFSVLLAALDLTAVSTILPTLTEDLNGKDNFTWVASAYALASAAILPLIGGLADVFGRKPVMMGCIILFSLGSALAGAAKNMDMMIAARSASLLPCLSLVCFLLTDDLLVFSCTGSWRGRDFHCVPNRHRRSSPSV